jgi:hypothetical protein
LGSRGNRRALLHVSVSVRERFFILVFFYLRKLPLRHS